MPDQKKLYNESELIVWLGLKSKRQLRSLRDKGMPHLKLNGHQIRYDPQRIEAWMQENAKK
jgi:hypothetical protein